MNTSTLSTMWKARTVNGVFQINFNTEYRGFRIKPVFNYSDGTTDFDVFEGDEERGWSFSRCSLRYVKEVINTMRDEKPEDYRVTTTMPFPEALKETVNITKFNSFTSAMMFSIRFNGVIND